MFTEFVMQNTVHENRYVPFIMFLKMAKVRRSTYRVLNSLDFLNSFCFVYFEMH